MPELLGRRLVHDGAGVIAVEVVELLADGVAPAYTLAVVGRLYLEAVLTHLGKVRLDVPSVHSLQHFDGSIVYALHPVVRPLLSLHPSVPLGNDVRSHLRTLLALVRVLHLPVHRQAVGYNVYMRLARVEVDGGNVLAPGQHRALAAHLDLGPSRPLVEDRLAVLGPHHLGFIVRRVEHRHTVPAKPVPLLHRPVPALLLRRAQFDAPERILCPVLGRSLQKLHIHQHLHGRVRLARQRVQLDVVGSEKDGLVLLPCLLLVVDLFGGRGRLLLAAERIVKYAELQKLIG